VNYLVLVFAQVQLASRILDVSLNKAHKGVDGKLVHLFGGVMGNIFNAHTTFLGINESRVGTCAVQSEGKVKLAVNSNLLDNVNSAAGEAISSRLLSHESVSEHLFGNAFHLLGRVNDVNTALESSLFEVTETATAAKHLGLDHVSIALEILRNLEGFLRAAGNVTKRDANLVGVEKSAGLILVEFHAAEGQGAVVSEGAVEDPASLCCEHGIILINRKRTDSLLILDE
jgi:hypothetical protein